ncbi:alpha/beta fold hydrolase [Antrihabitans cavernicola]|nr:alpha/beta hydrolase [Spelaeibacter cavernicola]
MALGTTFGIGEAAAAPAKPTVVLVHGAFADASSWDGVAAQLRAQGYPVLTPDNPLRGPSNDAAVIKRVLDGISGPVVLVGHSYGGEVITNAARNTPNVKALVYVSAIAPAQGEPGQLTIDPIRYPGSELLPPVLLPKIVDDPQGPAGKNLDVYIAPDRFREAFAADVPADKAAEMAARQKSLALAANLEPSGPPAYENHPSWWLLPTEDKAVPPSAQRAMAARAHSKVTEIAGSHAILVSHPEAVTALVDAADAATP